MVIAKGLGAGYQPIGALMVSGSIFDAIERGSGFFQHGHTYMAHPVACAAALEVQHVIKEENLLANVRKQGDNLHRALVQQLASIRMSATFAAAGCFRRSNWSRTRRRKHRSIRRSASMRGSSARAWRAG